MKDISYYKEVGLPYPRKEDFKTKYWYRAGKCIATQKPRGTVEVIEKGADLVGAVVEVNVDEAAYRAAHTAYNAAERAKFNEFKRDLFELHGVTDHPKAERCFSMAWGDGHSAGYGEVANVFDKLVDLIKD